MSKYFIALSVPKPSSFSNDMIRENKNLKWNVISIATILELENPIEQITLYVTETTYN